jgi:serine/threonine-protein phosphatase 2A regulatory subunit A
MVGSLFVCECLTPLPFVVALVVTHYINRRVRNYIAKKFASAAKTLGVQSSAAAGGTESNSNNESTIIVVACFVAVLTDFEPEVRAAAMANLAEMIAFAGPVIFASHLQPLLPTLADDVVMEVRSKCASALMDTAAANTLPDAVVVQAFGPLWESALHDDFPEVQLQVLEKLPKIAKLLPELPNTVAMILSMSKAINWRVRQAVAQLLPFLAQARDFATVLQAPTMALLLDSVAAVRNQIVSGTPLLVQTLGDETTYSVLWQSYLAVYEGATSYLVRSTILGVWIAMATSSQVTNPDGELHRASVGKITDALADPVPNVRRKAAFGLGQLHLKLPQLQDLADNDADEDVRSMAAWALDQEGEEESSPPPPGL